MAGNESVEAFLRSFGERREVLQKALEDVILNSAGQNLDIKLSSVKKAAEALDDLKRMLSANDRPGWITELEHGFHQVLRSSPAGTGVPQLSMSLTDLYPRMKNQSWAFLREIGEKPVDFDGLYQTYSNESKIPDLFDELVKKLQDILDSGLIDSVKAVKTLERLIATLKKNSRGSFFSMIKSKEFATKFAKHTLIDLASDIPGLKSLVAGAQKAIEEIEEKYDEMEAGLTPAIEAQTKVELKALPHHQEETRALPAPPIEKSDH